MAMIRSTRDNHMANAMAHAEPFASRPSVSDGDVGDYLALLKPRVMSLVVFTALVGMVVGHPTVHPVLAFGSLAMIAIGAGASGCLNMWWDADVDAVMVRTRGRPVPAGRIRIGRGPDHRQRAGRPPGLPRQVLQPAAG